MLIGIFVYYVLKVAAVLALIFIVQIILILNLKVDVIIESMMLEVKYILTKRIIAYKIID